MDEQTRSQIRTLALETGPRPVLVVLTGAGASAESGLRTYRGPDGLHEDADAARLVTADAWREDRAAVVAHFKRWREQALAARPSQVHRSLARLELALGRRMTLVTQNVDGLHERGESRRVLAMHGDLLTVRCEGRRRHVSAWTPDLGPDARCPATGWRGRRCGAPLRPNVVLFGEPVLHAVAIDRAIGRATAFWAIGTSGVVAPAATLVLKARMAGKTTALFNLTPPGVEARGEWASLVAAPYDHVILGRASETVPAAVDALLDACGLAPGQP